MQFDVDRMRNLIWVQIRRANMKLGQKWINFVIYSVGIPTWSGASRATFSKLASELGTTVPMGPRGGNKSRVSEGLASAVGSGVIEDKNTYYAGFKHTTSLGHLVYNEFNAPSPGPYPQPYSTKVTNTPYFFGARGAAYWSALASKIRLPNPYKYMTIKRMK